MWLAVRSIFWAVLFPGMVALYLPWRFFGLNQFRFDFGRIISYVGLIFMAAGTALLIACIVEFARSGRGTLAPVDAPKTLVVRGLYRYVRNPMYLSVLLILLGELMLIPSIGFLVYTAVWFGLVNLFVIAYEEPALVNQFGGSYERYKRDVGRWTPKFPAKAKGK
jgi:protein-S-isoprenylcysteine O-methyltransferase Ste14